MLTCVLVLAGAVHCGGGGDPAPDDAGQSDVQPSDSTASETVSADSEISDATIDTPTIPPVGSAMEIRLNGLVVSHGAVVDLPLVPISLEALEVMSLTVRSVGSQPLAIEKLMLAPFNEDGSAKNIWVVMDWPMGEPTFPVVLDGGNGVDESTLDVSIVFTPKTLDPHDATIRIVSNDASAPVAVIRLASLPDEPRARVDPDSFTFTKASLSYVEEQQFHIHNDGLSPLIVNSVSLNTNSDRFVLSNIPEPGQIIPSKDKVSYEPLTFLVQYQPIFGSVPENASVSIASNDPSKPITIVPLATTFETTANTSPCIFGYATEGDGVLNFEDTTAGVGTHTILAQNLGEGECLIQSVEIPTDPEGFFYSWTAQSISETGASSPATLPVAIQPGQKVAIDVSYSAPGYRVDGLLSIQYTDSSPHTQSIEIQGGGPQPCMELTPGTLANPHGLYFAGSNLTNLVRSLVIYNCSEGHLGLTGAQVEDTAGNESELWKLVTPILGYTSIAPFGIKVLQLSMYEESEPTSSAGELSLSYITQQGETTIQVPLLASIDNSIQLPVADPGSAQDYPNWVANQSFVLDGSASELSGVPVAKNGYQWALLQKPVGSQLVLTGAPGQAQRTVTPDMAGSYTFGLAVTAANQSALVSDLVTVTVIVQEPTTPNDPS